MLKTELPALYRDLLDLRTSQDEFGAPNPDLIEEAIIWYNMPEGRSFWLACHRATRTQDLPPIPEASLQELIDLNIASAPSDPMTPITDRNGNPLPEPYQSLAQERKRQRPLFPEDPSYALIDAFAWMDTPENHTWWLDVDLGLTPPIPEDTVVPVPTKKPEPKKHSTMEDVFVGMNRHAKKENSKEASPEEIKERDKVAFGEDENLLDELEAIAVNEPEGYEPDYPDDDEGE